MTYTVAVVGTGANPDEQSRDGFAMGYRHARAYRKIDDCELVACADIVRENAEQFAGEFGIRADNVYEDAGAMARSVEPDIVSVTVPPTVHADVVTGLAETGSVTAIHCEKPMAATWQGCQEMVRACEGHGVRLTINHQRRFGTPFRKAKSLLDDGEIGTLERVEFGGKNLFDAGTHQLDLCGYYTDQAAPEWVLGGIEYTEENVWFGAHNANQAVVQWHYETGVSGLAVTGDGAGLVGCYLRLVGSDGVIEVGAGDGPTQRFRHVGSGWELADN
jgi:predicted dehydrogenase